MREVAEATSRPLLHAVLHDICWRDSCPLSSSSDLGNYAGSAWASTWIGSVAETPPYQEEDKVVRGGGEQNQDREAGPEKEGGRLSRRNGSGCERSGVVEMLFHPWRKSYSREAVLHGTLFLSTSI